MLILRSNESVLSSIRTRSGGIRIKFIGYFGVTIWFKYAEIKITNEILSLINEIDEFKDAWKALGKLAPD